jgi:hypothetical protein
MDFLRRAKERAIGQAIAESTIADKAHHGFPTPKPLLRTGELRDSIEYTVHGLEGCVGSDLEIAVFQELGTRTIHRGVSSGPRRLRPKIKFTAWRLPRRSPRSLVSAATHARSERCFIYFIRPAMR